MSMKSTPSTNHTIGGEDSNPPDTSNQEYIGATGAVAIGLSSDYEVAGGVFDDGATKVSTCSAPGFRPLLDA